MGGVEVRMQPAPHPSPPRLEAGDRLTRVEFERRYALLHDRKAELVDGVVYMPSPARADHGRFQGLLAVWGGVYQEATPSVEVLTDATVRLDEDNEPQPDVMLRLTAEHGGRSQVDPDGYVSGPPELTIEVAASSSSYDLHQKKEVYRRSGCQEYMVVLVHEAEVRWFGLEAGRYEPLVPGADGLLRSDVFPGL